MNKNSRWHLLTMPFILIYLKQIFETNFYWIDTMKLIRIYFKRTMPRQPRLEKNYVPTAQGSFLHSYDMLAVFLVIESIHGTFGKIENCKFFWIFSKEHYLNSRCWGRMTFIALHLTEHLVAMTYIDTIFCVALIMNHIIWSI